MRNILYVDRDIWDEIQHLFQGTSAYTSAYKHLDFIVVRHNSVNFEIMKNRFTGKVGFIQKWELEEIRKATSQFYTET